MRSRRRLFPRLALLALGALTLIVSASALTASNTVPPSRAGQDSRPITPNEVKPAACAGLDLSTIVTNGTNANDLVLGSPGNDNLTGRKGSDCIVGGPGTDKIDGGKDYDVCLGGQLPTGLGNKAKGDKNCEVSTP